MNFLKNKLKELLYISIIFLITILIYTILIYFQILKVDTSSLRTITYITGLVLFLIYGLISGLIEKKNGWLSGSTSALIVILLFFIFNLFSDNKMDLSYFVKLLSYLLCSMVGGIIGINIKGNKK